VQAKERSQSLHRLQRYLERPRICSTTPYTRRKHINHSHGARYVYRDQCLIIELQNIDGKLQSAQRIFDDGQKRCWPKLPVAGAFHLIGPILYSQRLLICEGWATGCTLHEQTGNSVVSAMFAGNLEAVASAIRAKYPSLSITICGDDDRDTDGNPGRTKSTAAARAIGAELAFPVFPDGVGGSDFNDMHLASSEVRL